MTKFYKPDIYTYRGRDYMVYSKPLTWCEYGLSDYEGQIREVHPYDDADYYSAKITGNRVRYIQNGKVKLTDTLPVFNEEDYEDESEYLDYIIDIVCDKIRDLNRPIPPRMMHN